MTLKQFARRTGWPYDELLDMDYATWCELFRPFGLRMNFFSVINDEPRLVVDFGQFVEWGEQNG